MKLNEKALALAAGIFAGVIALIVIAISVATGWAKDIITLTGPAHPGFSYTYGGAVWMGILHFIVVTILAYVFAWLYNKLAE